MKTVAEISTMTATACAAILASVLFVTAAHADGPGKRLMLSVYSDTAGADTVLAGDYAATIKKLSTRGVYFQRDPIAASTNLCVAQIMNKSWDGARTTCDEAVSRAKRTGSENMFYSSASHRGELALAYSNRAVLNWLQNQPEKAVTDVSRAHSLAPRSEFVSQNWTALNGTPVKAINPAIAAIQH